MLIISSLSCGIVFLAAQDFISISTHVSVLFFICSGKEVGSLLNLPVLTERAGLLTENNLLSKKPKMLECLNEVIDLDSDDIENDDWDDDWLLDEVI